MATETAEPTTPDLTLDVAPEVTPEQEPEAEAFDSEKALAKIRKANAEAQALRARAKEAETKAATAEALAARVPELEATLVRERVARRLGLPDELVDRLRGATEAEVLADAESLVKLVTPKAPPKSAKPVESLQTGSGDGAAGETLDQRIAAAQKAKDWRTVLHLQNEKLIPSSK